LERGAHLKISFDEKNSRVLRFLKNENSKPKDDFYES